MSREIYQYSFTEAVDLDAVEATLTMAFLSAEALHGESQVRMDASHAFGRERRSCVIDASTEVGRNVCKLFTGYLQRELRADQFSVKRLEPASAPELAAVAA